MKHLGVILLGIALFSGLSWAGEMAQPQNENDKISYSVGFQIGGDFKRQGVTLNPDLIVKGIQDAIAGSEPLMAPSEMSKTLAELKRKIMNAQQEERRKAAEKNLAEGKRFLEDNAGKEGVKVLPSGLQYKVIKEGTGAMPKATDTVTVHYRGALIDGTEFDSSYSRGEPATFPLDRVIKGWTEGLQLMKEGGTSQLLIPPGLAYGEQGSGRVPPNSTLIFEVELISVKQAE